MTHASPSLMDRRLFLAAGTAALAPAAPASWTFGMIADVHHGLMPDAHRRLEAFLEEAQRRRPEFLIQLGDFCHPQPESRPFLRTWHSWRGPKHGVLGNHDMDFGTKRQILDLWEVERNYYSFDHDGFHFVVLDCNYLNRGGRFEDFAHGNYFGTGAQRDWVSAEQVEWLRADLRATRLPTVVFTHQCVGEYWARGAHVNRAPVKAALAEANAGPGGPKVVACFSGHQHADHHAQSDGVHYVLVNSASYYWVGESYGSLARYSRPLFTFVTLDAANGTLSIEGRRGEFVPPTPAQLRHPDAPYATAGIRARRLSFPIRRGS